MRILGVQPIRGFDFISPSQTTPEFGPLRLEYTNIAPNGGVVQATWPRVRRVIQTWPQHFRRDYPTSPSEGLGIWPSETGRKERITHQQTNHDSHRPDGLTNTLHQTAVDTGPPHTTPSSNDQTRPNISDRLTQHPPPTSRGSVGPHHTTIVSPSPTATSQITPTPVGRRPSHHDPTRRPTRLTSRRLISTIPPGSMTTLDSTGSHFISHGR